MDKFVAIAEIAMVHAEHFILVLGQFNIGIEAGAATLIAVAEEQMADLVKIDLAVKLRIAVERCIKF